MKAFSRNPGPAPTPRNAKPRRVLPGFSLLLAVWTALCGSAHAAPAELSPVLSGCEQDYPPFCIVHEDGQVDGFSVELLRAALNAMGRDVTFRTGPWAEVRGWLERGEVQVLPLVGRTPERETLFDFTVPYLTMHGAIVVRKDTTGVRDLNGLRGRRVGVMKGDNAEEFLRREERGLEIVTTATFSDALRELSEGRCDAVVVQRLVALRLLAETGLNDLRILDGPIEDFSQDFCFAVRENDRDLLALLNEGLALVVADGTHRRLHAKWFASLELPSNRPLIIGGDHNYPPFEFLDEKGRPAGFTVELTRAIARELNLDVQIRLGPWAEVVEALRQGEIDAIQGMFYSAERDKLLDFSPRYLVVHCVSVMRRGAGAPPVTLEELAGRDVVVQAEDAVLEILRERGIQARITTVETQEEILRAVAEGRHECGLAIRLGALRAIQKNGWTNLALGHRALYSGDYCYALPDGRTALLAELSEGLRALDQSGEYHSIHEKWLGVYEPPQPGWRMVLKHVALVAVPLLALTLAVVGWSWSLRRLVARRTAELASQFRLLRVAGETARFGGWRVELATNRCHWSEVVAEIHEMPPDFSPTVEEAIRFYAPEWRDKVTQLLEACARDGTPYDEQMEILTAGGKRVWVRTAGEAVRDESGRILHMEGSFQDITASKQAEAALAASERKWREILVKVPLIGLSLDPQGRIDFANEQFLRLTGWPAEDVLGQDWFDRFIPPADREEIRQAFRTVVTAKGTATFHSYENEILTRTGEMLRVAWSNVLTKDFQGNVVDVTCLGVDLTERVRAEASLRASEEHFRTLVEQSPVAIFIQTRGLFAYANSAALALFGCDCPEQLLGQPVLEWFHPDNREAVRERIRRLNDLREAVPSREEICLRRDDTPVTLEVSAVPFTYQEVNGALVLAHDVTEREAARRALASSEQRLREAILQSPFPSMLHAEGGEVIQLSHSWCEITGYSREELKTVEDWLQRAYGERQAAVRAGVDAIYRLRQRQAEGDFTVRTRSGSERIWEFSSAPLGCLPDGRRLVISMAVDVTDRRAAEARIQAARHALLSVIEDQKEAERALRESEEHFRSLLKVSPVAMGLISPDGTVSFLNDQFTRLFGYTRADVSTLAEWWRRAHPEESYRRQVVQTWEAAVAASLRERTSTEPVEHNVTCLDGTVRVVQVSGISVSHGLLVSFVDLTASKAVEARLRQQQKLESIGTLASGMAHEINNPITGIMNYAQLIQDRLPDDSPLTEFTGDIMHETQRVATLVQNLLTFSRNEKQSHSPARIADIIEGTLALIRTLIRRDDIALTVSVPEDLPQVRCRSQQLQQVLMNLMTNARDALNERYPGHDPDKVMRVEASLFGNAGRRWIRLTVEDHGAGIAPGVRERMFDPFFTTKPRDVGTGLGLSISHGIVKEHHGEVTVESEPGRFTRMHVDLPVDNGWSVR